MYVSRVPFDATRCRQYKQNCNFGAQFFYSYLLKMSESDENKVEEELDVSDPAVLQEQLDSRQLRSLTLNKALHQACIQGLVESCTKLLASGASVVALNKSSNNSSLHYALRGKDASKIFDVLKVLLKDKNSKVSTSAVNRKNRRHFSALYYAAYRGLDDCVRLLIECGAKVNSVATFERETALSAAVCKGHLTVVKSLIELGGDVKKPDYYNRTPLMKACSRCRVDIVGVLLEHGGNPNIKDMYGSTALMYGAEAGCEEIVEMLINHGADVNASSSGNLFASSVLTLAVKSRKLSIIQRLINAGAKDLEVFAPPVFSAVALHCLDILKCLIQNGFSIQYRDSSRKTILHTACYNFSGECLQYLLDHHKSQLDLYAEQISGHRTPLEVAVDVAWSKGVKMLLRHGADANWTNSGGLTAASHLTRPSQLGHGEIPAVLETVITFIRFGFDLNQPTNPSSTDRSTQELSHLFPAPVLVHGLVFGLYNVSKMVYYAGASLPSFQTFLQICQHRRHENENDKWFLARYSCVPSLAFQCRNVIRSLLHRDIENKIKQLPLPLAVQEYLNVPEMDRVLEENEVEDDTSGSEYSAGGSCMSYSSADAVLASTDEGSTGNSDSNSEDSD